MFKHILLATILLAASPVIGGSGVELTPADIAEKPALCLAAEMSLIPEVDTWEACDPGDYATSAAGLKEEWAKVVPWATAHVTPALAKALSRWAKPQMEEYAAVPSMEKLTFKPVTAYKAKGVVVYEAVVDSLPVHNPLVARRLIAYILYANESKAILRVTITIRGEVVE